MRYNLPVVYVVCNTDSWFAGVDQWFEGQIDSWKMLPRIRYDKMYEVLGCHAEQVTVPGEVAPALYRAFNSGKTAVVNVAVDSKVVPPWFEALADSQMLFTSNMFLAENNETDTTLFVNTVQVALAPPAYQLGKGLFAPRVGFRQQWFNYGLLGRSQLTPTSRVSDFDFDVQTIFIDGRYRFGENWIAQAGFDALRLLDHTPSYSSYRETYRELAPRWSLLRQVPFTETRVLALGYEGNYHFSNTPGNPQRNLNDRTEHSLLVAYTHALTSTLVVQPYYRLLYTRYTTVKSRNDLLSSFGLSLNYYFNSKVSVRTFLNYDHKNSDDPIVADRKSVV